MATLPMTVQNSPAPTLSNARRCLHFMKRRSLVYGVTALLCLTLLRRAFYFLSPFASGRWHGARLPPLYPQFHKYELELSQHHWNAVSHDSEPNFLFVPAHSRGSGWGNIMQEILLNAYLSYKTNRAFVFYNYTWNSDGSDYSDYNGKPIPSRIPLTALIRGPIVGAPFPHGIRVPLAIAEQYWDEVCEKKTLSIDRDEVHKDVGSMMEPITRAWVSKLASVEDQCVVPSNTIYDWIAFGDRRAMHDIWAEFSASPIVTQFGWSQLVELAFDNNREMISPSTVFEPPLSSTPYTSNAERYTELKGLLVLHLRRGDYQGHCEHLAQWSSSFLAFNALPQLEQFEPPPGASWGENTPENYEIYRQHCYPTVPQIVERVSQVRQSGAAQGLKNVYIMTNGAVEWVAELKDALKGLGFDHVSSSRDLVLSWEQKYVAHAMDMLVGQRAQVFIGNGWSSLTGGIVMMRTANGFLPESTRFL